jgi:LemA protein
MNGMYGFIIVAVLLIIYVIAIFNRLVSQQNRVEEAWSGIDVQLKRRHELIPNLVTIVKEYARHESSVFERVTQLRSQAVNNADKSNRSSVEQDLAQSLKNMLILSEQYPELKADANFRKLGDQLVETEDMLQMARRYYNGTVRDMNIRVESFPSNLVAKSLGFSSRPFFEVDYATERNVPDVDLT